MSENAVEICDLSYTYADGTHALNCLNAAIPKKKKTAILGANGCGKSTLLRHLNGLNKLWTIQSENERRGCEKAYGRCNERGWNF